jgi:hypothetical protein
MKSYKLLQLLDSRSHSFSVTHCLEYIDDLHRQQVPLRT